MSTPDYDALLANYKQSVDRWITAIRQEESFANSDHGLATLEKWEDASVAVDDAGKAARKARDEYADALREKNFNF